MPIVKCKTCKKDFFAKPSHISYGWGKYCSRKCSALARTTGKFVYCEICGKKIWRRPRQLKISKSKKYFCSKSHQTLWRNRIFSGEKHHNWKGGHHVKYKKLLIRNGVEQKCKICGFTDKRVLAVHHRDIDHSNNELSNLIFLCYNCHHLVHHHNKKVR